MSSFSIHFHPLQEASYNADRIRHTTAAGQREENSKTERKRKKNTESSRTIICYSTTCRNTLLIHLDLIMIKSIVLKWSDDGYADWTRDCDWKWQKFPGRRHDFSLCREHHSSTQFITDRTWNITQQSMATLDCKWYILPLRQFEYAHYSLADWLLHKAIKYTIDFPWLSVLAITASCLHL